MREKKQLGLVKQLSAVGQAAATAAKVLRRSRENGTSH